MSFLITMLAFDGGRLVKLRGGDSKGSAIYDHGR